MAFMGKKTTNWDRIEKALFKYEEESKGLERDFGYKTPPVVTARVKTTKKAAEMIDELLGA